MQQTSTLIDYGEKNFIHYSYSYHGYNSFNVANEFY